MSSEMIAKWIGKKYWIDTDPYIVFVVNKLNHIQWTL